MPSAVRADGADGGGRQLLHAPQDGARRRNDRMPAQVVVQGHFVDARIDSAGCHQRGQGGCEAQLPGQLRNVQRLDAQPVADQEDLFPLRIVNGDREHAHQVMDKVVTPFPVRLEDYLGVAGGAEAELGLKLPAQLLIVVDAPVEDNGQAAVVLHGLRPGFGEVNDAEPPVPQCNPVAVPVSPSVRSAGGHGPHDFQNCFPRRRPAVECDLAAMPHMFLPCCLLRLMRSYCSCS